MLVDCGNVPVPVAFAVKVVAGTGNQSLLDSHGLDSLDQVAGFFCKRFIPGSEHRRDAEVCAQQGQFAELTHAQTIYGAVQHIEPTRVGDVRIGGAGFGMLSDPGHDRKGFVQPKRIGAGEASLKKHPSIQQQMVDTAVAMPVGHQDLGCAF